MRLLNLPAALLLVSSMGQVYATHSGRDALLVL